MIFDGFIQNTIMQEQTPPPTKPTHANSRRLAIVGTCSFALAVLLIATIAPRKVTLGATADVTEPISGTVLKARVDTGAAVSSLHCLQIEVEDPADDPAENSDKQVRFLLESADGQSHWLTAKILGYSGIRNASGTDLRYRVRMRLICHGIEKETIVSLNDRSEMKYPLLLGRDFLQDDFVVDVSRDNPDFP